MMPLRIFAVGEVLAEFVAADAGGGHERKRHWEGPFASGAPAICMDQAARCGARASIVGGIGRDGFGRLIRRRLVEDGVDVSALAEDPSRATGVAFVAYRTDGGRDFVFHIEGSAAARIPHAPEDPQAIVHVSGSSLGVPALRHSILSVAERHLAAGGTLSLDPNVRAELFTDPDAEDAVRMLASRCHFFLPSLEDLALLQPGADVETAVRERLAAGARLVAVKRGRSGALVADRERWIDLPGYPVEEVDPTGAGDCFCGALLAGIAAGVDLETAGRRATAAGALSVTKRGPMEGAMRLEEIADFLARHGG